MKDSQTDRQTGAPGVELAGRNGRGVRSPEARTPDRRYLLRRETRFPFPVLNQESAVVRLRRCRRVSAPFSAIPPLARNGRH